MKITKAQILEAQMNELHGLFFLMLKLVKIAKKEEV